MAEKFTYNLKSDLYNHFVFNSRRQGREETLESYATELTILCKKCNYETADSVLLNTILRDQFIVGITNEDLQLKILEVDPPKLTFEEAIYLAREKFSQIKPNRIKSEDENCNVKPELGNYQNHAKKEKTTIKKGRTAKRTLKKFVNVDPSKIYACHFCSSAFRHERNLFRHYKKSHQDESIEGRIVCKEDGCNQIFFSLRGWKRHRSLVHDLNSDDESATEERKSDERQVVSVFQTMAVSSANSAVSKKKPDTKPQRYSCRYCRARFKHERNLIKHYKTNHSDIDIEGRIRCEAQDCSAIFFSNLGLRQHYTKFHLDLQNLSNVTEHEKTYRTEILVRKDDALGYSNEIIETEEHMVLKEVDTLYGTDDPAGKYAFGNLIRETISMDEETVNKMVVSKPILQTEVICSSQPIAVLQNIGNNPHQVDPQSYQVLESSIPSTPIMRNNEDNKVPRRERKRIVDGEQKHFLDELDDAGLCDICGKVFQDPNQHYRNVHATDRPFKCHLCNFSHPLKGHLAQHIRHKHMEAKFVCEVCGRKQRSAQAVKDHIAMVHQGLRPWPCPICPKTFAKKHYIEEHVKVMHRGELPFGCQLCNEKFSRRRALIMHRRTVHENKWFDCGACGKRFKEKCAVENHIRLVHENKFRYNCKICGTGYRSSKPFKDHMLLQHGVQK